MKILGKSSLVGLLGMSLIFFYKNFQKNKFLAKSYQNYFLAKSFVFLSLSYFSYLPQIYQEAYDTYLPLIEKYKGEAVE